MFSDPPDRHVFSISPGVVWFIVVMYVFDLSSGVNLRTGERGIFPAMYANDLRFLEDSGTSTF